MSLFDSASLVVTPNGYKEDKLYAIKPTDGSGDLVVTRATTATRVNSDGLIEQVPYNLFTYSEQLDNAAWVKTNVTITANATTAPSGNLSADKIIATATNSNHIVSNTPLSFISSQSYNFSYYAKSAEYTKTAIRIGGAGYGVVNRAEINLSNGTIIYQQGFTSLQVQSVGNGWYRIQGTFISATGLTPNIQPLSDSYSVVADNYTFLGDGTSGIFIWGAQLVIGTSAKEYFPTTDRLDVPRLDYTNSSCPSILVEQQRTNLTLRSDDFSNASWTKTAGVSVTANDQISPDGTQNADKVVFSAYGNNLKQNIAFGATGTYTHSFWAKGTAGQRFVYYDGIGDTTITLTSNWVRYTITKTYTAQTIAMDFNSYGTWNAGTLYLWGAQCEVGSYATSYIPTVASTVTRNADVISKTGISSLIGQTEGTLFMDCKINSLPLDGSFFGIQKTSSNFVIRFGSNGSVIYAQSYNGSTNLFYQTFSYTLGSRIKAAFAYKAGSYAFYINGVQIGTGSNATAIPACDATMFNSLWGSFNGSLSFYSTAALWKTRLTNAEIASLTTI